MDQMRYRAVIVHQASEGKTLKEIHSNLQAQYGGKAPCRATVANWIREHKWGRENLSNRPCTGRPPELATPTRIAKARAIVATNKKISLTQLALRLKIAPGSARTILVDHLQLEKKLGRWVPYHLTEAQKAARVEHARALLGKWSRRWAQFRNRLITVDETWVHHHPAPTPRSSAEWLPVGEEPPKIARIQTDRNKLMAIVFWDALGVVHLEYFVPSIKRPGINAEVYREILKRFKVSLDRKRPEKVRRGVLLLQDNAPCHAASRDILPELGIESVPHPPYSPDLAPSDYYLFRNLKNNLRGARFESDEALKAAVSAHFSGLSADYYLRGIDKLKEQLEAVIKSGGEFLPD